MARKFGASNTNRVGTGKIDQTESATEKWAGSVAAQVATAASIKAIMAKTIPVNYVQCDPQNPRKLALSQAQIIAIAQQYPLDQQLLQVEDATDWIEDYVARVGQGEQLTGKAIGDLESLVSFAAALKSADRLLHPIVVWREESTFHLIAGERRLLAHILLGESHIAARILEQHYSRAEIDTLQWEENVHRVDMSLWERVDHVKKLLETGQGIAATSVTKLSKILGRSRAESQRYLVILRYPSPLLLDAIKSGRVGDLKSAAALAQLNSNELQKKLFGTPSPATRKATIKFSDKRQSHAFATLLKAAAKQLKMESTIKQMDLHSPAGINEALALLIDELGDSSGG
jgi:ParB/RepB/Spo0J family partition protein